jgi:DNA polymerase-3 subunit delta'
MLFTGPEGIGKRTFAVALAQALLCERSEPTRLDPCGKCPSCLQVEADTHPDVLFVRRPEERQDLPIAVIRKLCLDLGMKPMRGSRRVAIVDDADELNEEAANAFLKTLEEPPPGSVLILIGTAAELQLDTIVSRCRVVRFDPLPESELALLLRDQGLAESPADAARLARMGEGSVTRARGLANPELTAFRRELIDAVCAPTGFDAPGLGRKLDAFAREAGKESVQHRARASFLVGELAWLFRGTLWQTAGVEPPAGDSHDRRAIASLGARLEPEDFFILADRCLTADYHISRNVNLAAVFDSLMYDLGRVINRSKVGA